MAESAKKVKKKGGRYCVAGAPNNQSCKNNSYTPGVTMHQFPLDVNTYEDMKAPGILVDVDKKKQIMCSLGKTHLRSD